MNDRDIAILIEAITKLEKENQGLMMKMGLSGKKKQS